MKVNEFIETSFVNSVNQTVNVGDEVLYAATSWSYTAHNKGTFAGIYVDEKGKTVAVKVTHNLSGEPYEKWCYSCLPLKRVYKLAK